MKEKQARFEAAMLALRNRSLREDNQDVSGRSKTLEAGCKNV